MLTSKSKRNRKFYNLIESRGNIIICYRDLCDNFEFGDCFLFENQNKKYFLIVTSCNDDEFVYFQPVDVSEIDNFNIDAARKVPVLYHSRKPILIDYIFGGEIPYGGFQIFFKKTNLEISRMFKNDLIYLFSINLDKFKVIETGGICFGANDSIQKIIEHSLNYYEDTYKRNKKAIMLKIPLENLCLE